MGPVALYMLFVREYEGAGLLMENMTVADYVVSFLVQQGITDVFGYPGGMVTHLMEAFRKREGEIHAHVMYHEQAAAFAACGYAQTSRNLGVAYATSGPGATNLITGICDAYFDSLPCLFITGQVNTNEMKSAYTVRQRGFQETNIVDMVKDVTKFSVCICDIKDIRYFLEKACYLAKTGRPGPVLLDIPMNILRSEIHPDELRGYIPEQRLDSKTVSLKTTLSEALIHAKRPVLIYGNGIKIAGCKERARDVAESLGMPVVSSMLSMDVLGKSANYFGFCGAYGDRPANFILAKADLIISIGSRLDIRQVGARRPAFAPQAKIIRIDIDEGEFSYPVHEDEVQIHVSILDVLVSLEALTESLPSYEKWLHVCNEIHLSLQGQDRREPTDMVEAISHYIPSNAVITTDVGQNQVWVAQAFQVKDGQEVLFSGGMGAMGYSLPAAIGAYYGSGKRPVYCFAGDGGLQMNIQEMQFLAREHLPICIIVLDNNALGMIRHFQEMYFDKHYFQTKPSGGYTSPDFCKIAEAYGIEAHHIDTAEELDSKLLLLDGKPKLIDIKLPGDTYVVPKLRFGSPNQDQEPLIDRGLFKRLMEL